MLPSSRNRRPAVTDLPVEFAEKRSPPAPAAPAAVEAGPRRLTIDISGSAVVKIVLGLLALAFVARSAVADARSLRVDAGRDLPRDRTQPPRRATRAAPRPEDRLDRGLPRIRRGLHRRAGGIRRAIRHAGRQALDGDSAGDLRRSAQQHRPAVSTSGSTSRRTRSSTSTRCRTSSSARPTRSWAASSPSPRSSSSRCSCSTSCRPSATSS